MVFNDGKIKPCCMLINLIDSKIHEAGKISFSKQECEIWWTNRQVGLSQHKDSSSVKTREKVPCTDRWREGVGSYGNSPPIISIFWGKWDFSGKKDSKMPVFSPQNILYPESSNSNNIKISLVHFYIFSTILILKIQTGNNNEHYRSFYGLPRAFTYISSFDCGKSLTTQV